MSLQPRQQKFVECFYPGLIEAIRDLGDGEFGDQLPRLKTKPEGIRSVSFTLSYLLADRMTVEIRMSMRLVASAAPWDPQKTEFRAADWECFHYALHYGEKFDDCTFRIDLDDVSGHHVHMRPKPTDHVPTAEVVPNVRDLDPRVFVAMVKSFRATGAYPLQRKKKP